MAVTVYKARTNFVQEVSLTALSLAMDGIALFVMCLMHRDQIPLSNAALILHIVVNSLKILSDPNHDFLYASIAILAALLASISVQNFQILIVAFIPVLLAWFEIIPSPFAVTYDKHSKIVGLRKIRWFWIFI